MASILKVDAMQGVTSAGDITITSEGGAATQSLQQGLAKAWVNFNGVTFGSRDSFNVSSLDDDGTGLYDINFTSSFSDGDYCATSTTSGGGNVCVPYDDYTQLSGTYNIGIRRVDTSAFLDASRVHYSMNGDLA
jgi:hypothetical protein